MFDYRRGAVLTADALARTARYSGGKETDA